MIERSTQASWRRALRLAMAAALAGCGSPAEHSHAGEAAAPEPWAVTAWGKAFEVFPEVDPLVGGQDAVAHTHVTVLDGFAPLTEGQVAIVLRAADGSEEGFEQSVPSRPGIFAVTIRPSRPGEHELRFRIRASAGTEEIAGGRVRVGTGEEPGGPTGGPAAAAGEEIRFLKEQQWRVPFATAWAEAGSLRAGMTAPGRVVPRPGGDRVLTAPATGRLEAEPWPYPGLRFARGRPVFRLVPRLDEDVSLAEREAAVAALEAELGTASARARRFGRLAEQGVVARDEAEAAAGERDALAARLDGARRDLETVARARAAGAPAGETISVPAPFDGVVAAVEATPGQTVGAGATIAHFVQAGGWWLELALPPRTAAGLAPGPLELALRPAGGDPIVLPAGAARLVSLAPEVDAGSGRVLALVELPSDLSAVRPGEPVEVELAGGAERHGVVLPRSALVDDAGVPIVYVQSSGEGFQRRPVRVLATRADRAVVEGVRAGERVVTQGGAAIRRATLAGAGVGEGHVH